MADVTTPGFHEMWTGALTFGGGLLVYFFRKRDKDIDGHGTKIEEGQKEHARLELQVAKEYATKESLRLLFQETQNTNRETAQRLEKQIDETKTKIESTNTKLDNMQTAIMSELSKKT